MGNSLRSNIPYLKNGNTPPPIVFLTAKSEKAKRRGYAGLRLRFAKAVAEVWRAGYVG